MQCKRSVTEPKEQRLGLPTSVQSTSWCPFSGVFGFTLGKPCDMSPVQ